MFACGAARFENIMTPKGFSWQKLPLTPGRIPKCTIPLKLPMSPRLCCQIGKDEDTYKLLSPESPEEESPGHRPPTGSPSISAKLRLTPKLKLKRLPPRISQTLRCVQPCLWSTVEGSPHLMASGPWLPVPVSYSINRDGECRWIP